MMKKRHQEPTPQAPALRAVAEATLRTNGTRLSAVLDTLSPEATSAVLHELQVHQIELEMQNEELRRAQVELEASQDRYFDLYDLAPVGYLTLNEAGLILETNLTAATLLGAVRDTLVKQPFSRFIANQDQDRYYLCRNKLLASAGPQSCELRMVKADGTGFHARLETALARDAGGTPVCRLVLSDVSDSKRSERALITSEKKYRELHQSMMDAFVSVAMDGRIIECNRTYQEMLGYTEEELRDLTYLDVTPEDWHAFENRLVAEQVIPRGYSDLYEKEYRRKDGTIFPVELRTFLLRDDAGTPTAMWAIIRDITRRRQVERALETSERRYRQLVEATEDLVTIVDAGGRFNFANRQAQVVFGLSPDELVGRRAFEFVHPDDRERTEQWFLTKTAARTQQAGIENRLVGADGRVHYLIWTCNWHYDAQGDVVSVSSIARDFTKRRQAEDALRTSEALLNATQHLSKVGGWMWDIEQQRMFWTKEAERIHEFEPEDVVSTMQEYLAKSLGCCEEAHRPVILAAFMRCVEHGDPYKIEHPFTTAKGRRLWVRTAAHAVWDGTRIVKVVGNIIDITERRQAIEALRQSQELLSQFIRVSPIYSFIKVVTPTESRVLHASDNYQEMIGISGPAMVGKTMEELFPAAMAAKITADDLDIVTRRRMLELDEELNGRHYVSLKFPLNQGDQILLGGYTIDVTERKQAELKLREWNETLEQRVAERTLELQDSEGRFRQLAAATFEGIAITEGGILQDCNPRFAAMHGYEPAEMLGRPVADFIAPESRALVAEHRADGIEATYEYAGMRKDGSTFPVEVHGQMGPWMGRPTRISALRDLTELKQTAAKLRTMQAELAHAQHLALVSEVSAGIIHQLGQPLSAIGANLSAMVKLKGEELQRNGAMEIVRDIEADVRRMRDITVHLRALANPMRPPRLPIDINAIVAAVLPLLKLNAESLEVSFAVELGKDLPTAHVDSVQISQVVLNLVRNAIEASADCPPERRVVAITTWAHAGTAVGLSVRDAGTGIAPEALPRLFSPFFSTKAEGLGVGLRLSQTIVQAHGGTIEGCNNPDGVGATFRLLLPVATPP